MAVWGVLFVLAVAGTTVLADSSLTFPEVARELAPRIVSGWEAKEGQFPFQLSLRMVNQAGGVNACGATIIHSEWGLTAAHCTAGRVTLVVRAGTVNLTRPAFIFESMRYFNHPLYNEALQSVVQPHDIGLFAFDRQLDFTDLIQPIRLQRSSAMNDNYDGALTTASGWGVTWTQGTSPENLNWVFLRGVSNLECWFEFGGSSIIQPSTICARGYNETTQSTCSGDSGGPLTVIDADGAITQIGIASFVSGTGCHTDVPAGFIRPGHYHDWYTQVTGINFDWEYTPEGPFTTTAVPESSETTESDSEDSESESSESESSESESSESESSESESSESESSESESSETK